MFYFYGMARTSTAVENSNESRYSFRSFDVDLSGHKTSHESEPTENNTWQESVPFPYECFGKMWIGYAAAVRAVVYRNQYWTWARTATTKSFILSTQFNFVHLFHSSFHTAVNMVRPNLHSHRCVLHSTGKEHFAYRNRVWNSKMAKKCTFKNENPWHFRTSRTIAFVREWQVARARFWYMEKW